MRNAELRTQLISEMNNSDIFTLCMGVPQTSYLKISESEFSNTANELKNIFAESVFEKYIPDFVEYTKKVEGLLQSQQNFSNILEKNKIEKEYKKELFKILRLFLSTNQDSEEQVEITFKRFKPEVKSKNYNWREFFINSIIKEIRRKHYNSIPMFTNDAIDEMKKLSKLLDVPTKNISLFDLDNINFLKKRKVYDLLLTSDSDFNKEPLKSAVEEFKLRNQIVYDNIDIEFVNKYLKEQSYNDHQKDIVVRKGANKQNHIVGQLALRISYLALLEEFVKDKDCKDIREYTITNDALRYVSRYFELRKIFKSHNSFLEEDRLHYLSKLIRDHKLKNIPNEKNLESHINNYKSFLNGMSEKDYVILGVRYNLIFEKAE